MSFAITAVATSAIGIGMSVLGASQQASAQRKAGIRAAEQGGIQMAQDTFTAKQIIEQSKEKAERVRASATAERGRQIATAAASGVLIGDGSAQAMVDEVTRLSEQDAVAILWEGANGSITASEQGRLAYEQGQWQYKQSQTAANTTLIQGYGSALSQLGSAAGKAYDVWGGKVKT